MSEAGEPVYGINRLPKAFKDLEKGLSKYRFFKSVK